MDHKFSPEFGNRIGSVDVCEVCGVLRIKTGSGKIKYVTAEREFSDECPSCKHDGARREERTARETR
jgi:hypothetical protein